MTVPSTTNKWIYTGNGVATAFAYTKKIFDETDLVVELITIATGASETLTLTTDYTVDGVGSDDGGNVTLTGDAPENTHQLVIRRVIPITQEIEPVENDPNRAATFEEAIDRGVMIAQQLQEQIDRSILQNPTQTSQITLPNAVADRLIGWDAAGTKLENKVALSTDVYVATEAAKDAAETAQGLAEDARDAAIVAKEAAEAVAGFDIANQEEAEAGTNNTKLMTPLRSAEAIAYLAMKQDGTVNPTNLLSNGNFEAWSSGASAAPDGWSLPGAGSVAREGTEIKMGTYSAKLTAGATDSPLRSQFTHIIYQGKTVTASCWVKSSNASDASIVLRDGVAALTRSSYHTGGGDWELLTVSKTIDATSTVVQLDLSVATNTQFAYFDGAMCVEGASAFAFSPKPAEEGVWADYSAVSTIVGWSSFSTRKELYLKKVGKTVFCIYAFDGTSNSTAINFTVPYAPTNPPIACNLRVGVAYDNNATYKDAATLAWGNGTTTINVYSSSSSGTWTKANRKYIYGQFWYESA